ncbi:MAG: CHAT domain-containing protein [Candidatus Aminicenantes bacterium]|nr:MAG: CHAT domain-containing protein [Candidatus Aminicenantes bacterium]
MKNLTRLIMVALMFLFSPCQILLSFQNNSSASLRFGSEEKYSEYFNKGENFRLKGDYEESIDSFEKSLELARKNNDKEAEINSLIKLGLLRWNTGYISKSIKAYEEALSIAKKAQIDQKKNEVSDYIHIYEFYRDAKAARREEDYKKSIENFEKAIELARKIESEEHELRCLIELSVVHILLHEIDKLFSLNKDALEIARRIRHRQEQGRCLFNIGYYYRNKDNNYSQALRHYEDALSIARIIKDYERESECLMNIGEIYIQLGNYDKALEYQKNVLKIDKERLKKDDFVAIDLNNIGVTYQKKYKFQSHDTDDLENALTHYAESLRIARNIEATETEIEALTNMGMAYMDLEDYPEALKYFKLALEKAEITQDLEEKANLYINIGIVNSLQKNYDSALKYCQQAIDTAYLTGKENILWEAYFEIASVYMRQDAYEKALENFRKSISFIEKIRSRIQLEELKAKYLAADKRIEAYQNTINLLCKLHDSEPEKLHNVEAFNYLERAKARAFLDRMEASQMNISQGVDKELLIQEEEELQNISSLNLRLLSPDLNTEQEKSIKEQIRLSEERIEALKRKIRLSSPAYTDLKYPQFITLEQTQKHMLDSKTAFFEYSLGVENSYAFVITKKEFKIFPLPASKKIQEQVSQYLRAITDKDIHDFSLGYELFTTLVLPGLDEKIEKLIFIPDDILHYLPFETLLSQKDEKRWLVEDYKIAYTPSISSLREIIEHERLSDIKPRKDLLAFGDPFFGSDEELASARDTLKTSRPVGAFNVSRLEYSGQEVERIASLFKKTKSDTFKGKEASEEKLKDLNLRDYKIFHLATHCLIDDKKPDRSSIVFSIGNASAEDEILQMREVFNLKLSSDLVTLSACQTGLGEFIRGEGIEGLSRSFFYAGASSTLISLWPVHDQATSQFMERYYSHLRSSNSIMDSLQKTKLEMINSDILSHPYYWAGFIITGNSDKVIYPSTTKRIVLIIFLFCLVVGVSFLVIFKKLFRSSPSL